MPDPTPAALLPFFLGLRSDFYEAYDGEEVWWQSAAMTMPSDTELELYGWMDRLPAMREWIGSRLVTEPIAQNRTVTNRHWEITSSISRDKFVDDKHGIYAPIIREHARQAAKQHDYQTASLIETNPTCFDGQAFFSTAHPQDTSGQQSATTYSNDLTTLALNPTNFGTVKTTMRKFKGRDGKPLNVRPSLLLVPPNLEEAATVLRDNDFFSPSTFGNQTQQVGMSKNIYQKTFDFIVVPEFTHDNIWYVLDNRREIKPFLVQLREAINMVFLVNPNDPNVFWMKEYVWGADMRSAYDVTIPWLAVRCGASL
jgi:phage major head subunit gpT-like protein